MNVSFSVLKINRTVTVSSSIEHICIYDFNSCKKLQSVEFSDDSKLQTIDKESFRMTSIEIN